MDIQEKINSGYYNTKLPYPQKPQRPTFATDSSMEEAKEYISDLQVYHAYMDAYKSNRTIYDADTVRLTTLFCNEAIADVFGDDAARFPNLCGVLYNLAYEHGHSNGLSEVYNYLQDYAKVVNAIKEDLGEM
jgi:hypothetical protein